MYDHLVVPYLSTSSVNNASSSAVHCPFSFIPRCILSAFSFSFSFEHFACARERSPNIATDSPPARPAARAPPPPAPLARGPSSYSIPISPACTSASKSIVSPHLRSIAVVSHPRSLARPSLLVPSVLRVPHGPQPSHRSNLRPEGCNLRGHPARARERTIRRTRAPRP